MTTVRQPTNGRRSCVLALKYTFICVSWWTRQRIHNTLIVIDRYPRLTRDKMIPDSAEPRLESFYPSFIAGIDLPHQGVEDSYRLLDIFTLYSTNILYECALSYIYINIVIHKASNREYIVVALLQDCWNMLGLKTSKQYFRGFFFLSTETTFIEHVRCITY